MSPTRSLAPATPLLSSIWRVGGWPGLKDHRKVLGAPGLVCKPGSWFFLMRRVAVPLIPKTPLGGPSLAGLARVGLPFASRFVFIDLARPFYFVVSAF